MAKSPEEVKKLKDSLKQRKGVITRYISRLRRLLSEKDPVEVKGCLSKVKNAFDEFDNMFMDFVVSCGDDDETYNEIWYDEVQKRYIDVYSEALKFVTEGQSSESVSKPPKKEPKTSINESQMCHEYEAVVNLPRVEIEPFDGDPLKYHAFLRTFDVIVERTCADPDARLARLISATTGPARDAILGTQVLGGREGYDQAKKTLAELFGADQLIVQEIVKGLRPEKQLRSSEQVRQFSHRLINARDILSKLNALDEVNSQVVIKSISESLPNFAQNDWRKLQLTSKREKGTYLKFVDLVTFVQKLATDMADPLCYHPSPKSAPVSKAFLSYDQKPSPDGTSGKSRGGKRGSKSRAAAPASESADSSSARSCMLCEHKHVLWRCDAFKGMTVAERSTFVQQNNLCANCLKADHLTHECMSANRCLICKGMHSVFLHSDTSHAVAHGFAFMPVVKVQVNGTRWVLAALDNCSSATFCSKELANSLNLKGTNVQCHLKTLSGITVLPNTRLVSLTLSNGPESMHLSGVRVIDEIPITCGQIEISDYPHLQGIDLSANLHCTHVDLLIGQDCAEALVPLAVKKGRNDEPFAVQYKFGWTLNGRVSPQQMSNLVISHFISNCIPAVSHCNDFADFPAHEHCEFSVCDKWVMKLWDDKCTKVDGHYELPIPFKDKNECIPSNFYVAKKRLDALLKRLEMENLFERYDAEIKKMIAEGYVEVADSGSSVSDGVWYLPHHHVINPKKPAKLRVVFDCASKYKGRSLNERVHQGPDLVNGLFSVLLKFRLYQYAIQADIKGMYNQVLVPLEDRDVLRFLWYVDGQLVHYRMKVHLFGGVWCSSVATYALRRIIQDHPDAHPLLSSAVRHSMYVDDCLISVNIKEDAILLIDGLPELLNTGGFVLTKFVVNDEELLKEVPKAHAEVHEFTPEVVGRTLGVKWNVYNDSFCYEVKFSSPISVVTRRSILSFVNSIFDPLGLSYPWIITGRLLFQAATRQGLGWDDQVADEISSKWHAWIQTLQTLHGVQFGRCLIGRSFFGGHVEFHVFADASQSAYGACIYIRCVSSFGEVSTNLVAAKAHVAPLKQQTIPRLELQAAVTAVKLAASVKQFLGLDNALIHYWCDSQIVLAYIASDTRRFKTFVANRVGTIRSLSSPQDWRYVISGDNPADMLTKCRPIDTETWKFGPQWLQENYPFWYPRDSVSDWNIDDNDPEVSKVVLCTEFAPASNWIDRMAKRYSSWVSLRRGVAWILKFCEYLKRKRQIQSCNLSAADIQDAQTLITLRAQSCGFPDEFGGIIKRSSRIFALSPFKDESGLLRVGGRTGHHPVLVPHSHPISALLLRYYHELSHSGVEWTLSRVREKFWVTKARSELKKIRASCVNCKKMFGKPETQIMADLPMERISPNQPPFSHVGVDVFGPMQVSVKRSSAKRYGCIFTCFTTRAVHLEVINSLDSDAFLNAFRRFIARRGLPKKVFSDNAKNFVAGESELRKEFKRYSRETLASYGANHGIEWVFIPPHAPHMGGVWERMVGVIKRVLKAVTGRATRLTDEILSTFLCETESIVNSRPLTKLSDDPNDISPLTPNHLLLMRSPTSLPPCVPSKDAYRCRWRYIQHLATEFWKRFVREYLPLLNRRNKWNERKRNVSVGDLVMVQQPGLPRGLWPLAIVVEVSKSSDGAVRSATVRTKSSKFCRPIVKLIPLELKSTDS